MILPGRQRAGFVLTLIGAATLLATGGAWALFSGYGFVLRDAAASSDVRHLNDLLYLQDATWMLAALVGVLLAAALAVLHVTERRRARASEAVIGTLMAYAAGDWSRTPHVHDGDPDPGVAEAVAALGEAMRRRVPSHDAAGLASRFLEDAPKLHAPASAVRRNIDGLLRGEAGKLTRRQAALLRDLDADWHGVLTAVSDWGTAMEAERGTLRIDAQAIDAADVIAALALEFRAAAKAKKLAFRVDVGEGLPPVLADRLRLHDIFSRLLHQAIRSTPSGRAIALKAETEGDDVRFEVHDGGPGIPPSARPQAFSGLDLSVVRSLVEAHGGRIGFSSVEGRGTAFRFTLPASVTTNAKPDAASPKPRRVRKPAVPGRGRRRRA